ncbi:flagellar export chaperone FliS [Caldalkalibacillus thermarum TA2.A1]|uniref:Flagellar secretion chaperone FliS n=1 Tax=Caldalkalibacillus thermarum (strain TA2.A1) TaxID=986075 RepID=A0A8X8LAW6_CALTT|nr:flagellar export chaperone FliS [Caldalkalibacillus thermarum]QZT33939.1 flagellar export chaperone FliS [Caldalkalibacillus thermarum TA2.A1]
MSVRNPYQTYKHNAVQTASPGELTLMLYNGCLNFIKQARQAIEEDNIQERNKYMQKAQDIIRELMVTLNTDYAVVKDMLRMYDYILRRLIEANINNDTAILDEVETYVSQFRDTWKEVLRLNRQKQYGGGVPHDGKL